jgi:hypothetical protein
MNIYHVVVDSEKSGMCDGWTLPAGSVNAAIGKAIRRTIHKSAKRVSVTCQLLARNMSWQEWKAKQESAR